MHSATHRVFLGAPSVKELSRVSAENDGKWSTVYPRPLDSAAGSGWEMESKSKPDLEEDSVVERISEIYRNVIFGDDSESFEEEQRDGSDDEHTGSGGGISFISWPPSLPRIEGRSHVHTSGTFRRDSTPLEDDNSYDETQYYDYATQRSEPSISRFPQFHFPVHSLTAIGTIQPMIAGGGASTGKKIAILAAILEVDGPDTITLKTGRDAGKETTILKMILGDEVGKLCKLTAWREVADAWGGDNRPFCVQRGDVVYIENVTATRASLRETPSLTASPFMKSNLTICYRTLLSSGDTDSVLRPDLRLGDTEPCVQRVAQVVSWFQQLTGKK